jgi:hypothetical protein
MAGYSGTPLAKKLGIKESFRVAFPGSPKGFLGLLVDLPAGVNVTSAGSTELDLLVFFTTARDELSDRFPELATKLVPNGMLWISWPKKTSGVATDLDENIVRAIGLAAGLVDTKVCAIDETWSGLKFVIRVKDRPSKK